MNGQECNRRREILRKLAQALLSYDRFPEPNREPEIRQDRNGSSGPGPDHPNHRVAEAEDEIEPRNTRRNSRDADAA